MTWIDNNGDVRPQSWEEYCEISDSVPSWMITHEEYRPRIRLTERERIPRMRERLYRADPHCFWCGRRVYLNVAHASPELATVDHLYSRLHPEREHNHRQQKAILHVLACFTCNGERSVQEQRREPFIPKLAHRLEYAQRADATLATGIKPVTAKPTQSTPKRMGCTLAEAVQFAREHPSR